MKNIKPEQTKLSFIQGIKGLGGSNGTPINLEFIKEDVRQELIGLQFPEWRVRITDGSCEDGMGVIEMSFDTFQSMARLATAIMDERRQRYEEMKAAYAMN